jgi:hypothetical protein
MTCPLFVHTGHARIWPGICLLMDHGVMVKQLECLMRSGETAWGSMMYTWVSHTSTLPLHRADVQRDLLCDPGRIVIRLKRIAIMADMARMADRLASSSRACEIPAVS